jgi:hypothetical protein
MGIKNTVKDAIKAPSVAELRKRLAEADAEVASLNDQYGEHALAAESGDSDAAAQLVKLQDSASAAHRRVIALRAAIKAAEQAEVKREAEAKAAVRKSLVDSIRAQFRQRESAAVRIVAAIENLALAYEDFQRVNDRISKAIPSGTPQLPASALLSGIHLRRAIASELFRAGHGERGANGIGYPNMIPGAEQFDFRSDPETMTPFDKVAKDGAAYVMAVLEGKVVPAPSTVADPIPAAAPLTAPSEQGVAIGSSEQGVDPATVEAATLANGPKLDATTYTPQRVRMS